MLSNVCLLVTLKYSDVRINIIRNSDGHKQVFHVQLNTNNYKTLMRKRIM